MSARREGSRWHLRWALAGVLAFDAILIASMLGAAGPGPRAARDAPAWLSGIAGHPELAAPIALVALAALARFAAAPGRLGAALAALGAIFVLCEARASSVGGPERFLFAGGTVLVGWIAGHAFVRVGGGPREAEERAGEIGAASTLAAIYVNAGVQKLLASGLGWADGDDLRMLVLSQRPLGEGSWTDALAEPVIASRGLALALASFVEIAQLAAIAYPFHMHARAIVGTMLLAFHIGVRLLTPISFPQSMALLAVFSYPWHAVLVRTGHARPDPLDASLAPHPMRGAAGVLAGLGAIAALSFVPPVRGTILALTHEAERRGGERISAEATPAPPFDGDAARTLGLARIGERLGPCVLASIEMHDREIRTRFACAGAHLEVEIVPSGTRPFAAPRSAGGRDLYYRSSDAVPERIREALLDALAARLERP